MWQRVQMCVLATAAAGHWRPGYCLNRFESTSGRFQYRVEQSRRHIQIQCRVTLAGPTGHFQIHAQIRERKENRLDERHWMRS